MESNELMIGDWVMLNPDLKEYYPFAGKPCMVIGLHDDDGAIKIEYDNGKYFWTDAEDDVLPIPLTPEILEENGFNIEIAPYTPDWKRCILNPNFFLEDRLKGFYHFNGNNLAKIQYVHELQHALKLCGIDKTIEL